MRYTGEKKLNTWVAMALGIPALFLFFAVYPLVLVLHKSMSTEEGKLSFSYFTKFFARECYWSTLMNSPKVTIVSTLVATFLGLVMAYMLRSVKVYGGKYLNILIVIPYLSPPFIGAYAWIRLLGYDGFITRILNSLFQVKLGGIYGFASIVLVFSLQSFSLVRTYISGALENLDNSSNEAVESLGCTAFRRIMQAIVPLVMPTMLASSLLIFMGVFSNLGTFMLIGEGYKTFSVLVYGRLMDEVNTDDRFIAALCVIIIVAALVLLFFQRYLGDRFTYSMTALKPIEAKHCTGTEDTLSHLLVYAVVFAAALPQLTAILTSFLATGRGTIYTGGFSLENYRNIPFSKDSNGTILNTYLFSLCIITIVVVPGVLISYLIVRRKSFLTDILDTVTMLPYIIPGSILSIPFLYAFNSRPMFLSGTATIIIIPLSIRRMPYTIRSSTAVIGQINPSVKEAVISLGCTETKFLVKITVSMMISGVFSGTVTGRITLISKLSSSIILYTNKTQTLTVIIYAEVIRSNLGNTAVYSTILILTSIVSLLVSFKVMGNNDISI